MVTCCKNALPAHPCHQLFSLFRINRLNTPIPVKKLARKPAGTPILLGSMFQFFIQDVQQGRISNLAVLKASLLACGFLKGESKMV